MRRMWMLILGVSFMTQVGAQELIVSAASSLTNALTEIGQSFNQTHPTVKVKLNWGGSGALARQISQGAPVDVFISASNEAMDLLQRQSLIDPDTRRVWLHNQLVLIVPLHGSGTIHDFMDLAHQNRVSIGDPRFVPAGMYANQVMRFFNIDQAQQAHWILAANVRQVLTYVAQGEVEAGVVFKTDALLMPEKVKVVAIAPEDAHEPITYPVAVMRQSKQKEAAEEFIRYLTGPQAREVLTRFGFQLQ